MFSQELLVLRNDMLEHQCKSADRWSRTVQIVIPWINVTEILGEMNGGYLSVNKILDKFRQW
jgi:hypothetical protein